jgi:hypothetical protein
MLTFVVAALWLINRSFPSQWPRLLLLYVGFVPVGLTYGWLTDPGFPDAGHSRPFRLPKLLVVATGVVVAAAWYLLDKASIDAVFYTGS